MKKIMMIAFLFGCFGCYGQMQVSGTLKFEGSKWVADTSYKTHYDTVNVVMLCADTFFSKDFTTACIVMDNNNPENNVGCMKNHVPFVFWQYGYEVYSNNFIPAHEERQGDGIWWTESYIRKDLIKTLDNNKQPIKESVIIWQSIKIK